MMEPVDTYNDVQDLSNVSTAKFHELTETSAPQLFHQSHAYDNMHHYYQTSNSNPPQYFENSNQDHCFGNYGYYGGEGSRSDISQSFYSANSGFEELKPMSNNSCEDYLLETTETSKK